MFQISVIVFREILEIALILSILFGATNGIKNRTLWILSGLAAGVVGSIILAFFTDSISDSFDGMGQELLSAVILFIATLMIGYTVVWMKAHSKNLAKELKELGKSVIEGEKSLYTLFAIVSLSVLREGAEIVLFTYSYYIAGTSIYDLLLGSLLGFGFGLIVGLAFYFGLLKALGKYFFSVTTTILIFLCAGLMSQSLGYLTNADLIPTIIDQVWDSSFLISEASIVGNVLNILTGYVAKPSLIQIIAYVSTVLALFGLIKWQNKKS